MTGFLHLIVPASRFRLLRGADGLATYTFNTGTARHLFCRRCGIKSFYVPRSNPDGYSVKRAASIPATIEARRGRVRRAPLGSTPPRRWRTCRGTSRLRPRGQVRRRSARCLSPPRPRDRALGGRPRTFADTTGTLRRLARARWRSSCRRRAARLRAEPAPEGAAADQRRNGQSVDIHVRSLTARLRGILPQRTTRASVVMLSRASGCDTRILAVDQAGNATGRDRRQIDPPRAPRLRRHWPPPLQPPPGPPG